ncbi:MAG: lipid droplet-associated protein [Geodermatophilaceae bacterium]|nr:lipid droplet-associated protein [Geodermatophilaceae bacterium]
MPPDASPREFPATPRRSVDIPEPIRAAAGLAATVLDQARQLPSAVTGLPVKVAGLAMQTSLRLQQRYAGLIVKGDEVLTQISRTEEADPPWATFDDDVVGVADAVTEDIGVDVTAADDASNSATSGMASPSSQATTRTRPPRQPSADSRMGHTPSAFDLAHDIASTAGLESAGLESPASIVTPAAFDTVGDITSNGHASTSGVPVPGYDAFTLAQLRARLRTFDAATLDRILSYERAQRARAPYLTMLENRLNRSREQG